jgi:hypothetical protein
MIQPGAFGDIFVCAPIAKFYHEIGYEIYWPTAERFRSTIEKFPYVNHVILGDDERDSDWLKSDVLKCLDIQKILDPDIVLNLADRGPHTTAERPGETYEQPKYRLAGVDMSLKHRLSWERSIGDERTLALLTSQEVDCKDYIFVHRTSSLGDEADMPPIQTGGKKIVEMRVEKGFEIVDWYQVIMNASEVYCVESAVHCFIDGFIHELDCPRYLLSRPTLKPGETYTISEHWDKRYIK